MTGFVPPFCDHGPMVWRDVKGLSTTARSYAGWFPSCGAWLAVKGCKAIFVRVGDRVLLPGLVPPDPGPGGPGYDPWAGAPAEALAKGIRLQHPDGNAGIWTDTHSYWKTDIFQSGPWAPRKHGGLQHCLDANRGRDHRFPDFDGAPEGFRFFFLDGTAWKPRVFKDDGETHGPFTFRGRTGWESKLLCDFASAKSLVSWYRQHFSVVLVDELPAETPEQDLRGVDLDDLLDEIRRRLQAGEIPPVAEGTSAPFKREAA